MTIYEDLGKHIRCDIVIFLGIMIHNVYHNIWFLSKKKN